MECEHENFLIAAGCFSGSRGHVGSFIFCLVGINKKTVHSRIDQSAFMTKALYVSS